MATVANVNELGSYAHNPRGNLWFNDESSYGQKLLLKMGWRKGKGLGKKEDGIKENLKVKFKNTNSGLGYKDDAYNNVMKTEYESILKSLRDEYPQQKTVNDCNKNVEHENQDFKQKSRIVRSKIRYPKLYYGKDVSKYSDKDMKSIFICSLPFKNNEEEECKDSGLCVKEESKDSGPSMKEESENQLSKVQETYTSHLSVSDYFNMKMKEKKDNEQKIKSSSKVKQKETDSCCNKINYEIKTDFPGNKTDYKVKEDIECNKTDSKVDQEKYFQCYVADDARTCSGGKKRKKKHKLSEININSEDEKNVLPVMEKERKYAASPNKKQKKTAKDSMNESTFCEKKTHEKSNLMVDKLNVPHRKRKKSYKKECLNSSIDTMDLSVGQSNIHTNVMPNKKRKRSHKNDDISVDAVELLSVTSRKHEVSAYSELVNNIPATGLMEINDKSLPDINNNNNHRKKQKKVKGKLKKLKSCLKSKSSAYSVKNVSFNENVSYKIIDSDDESTGSLSDCQDKIKEDSKISASNNPEHEEDSCDNKTEVQDCSLIEQTATNCSSVSETVSKQKAEMCDSLFGIPSSNSPHYNSWIESQQQALKRQLYKDLPSSNSPHYNSWIESQQQALKMQMYKDLLSGIKKHDILKTTNLSFIKGYGNWGF